MSQDWVRFTGGEGAQPESGRGSFVVGVIANLSACTGCERWKERMASRFVDVDRDNVENLLARVAPRLDLELPGCEAFSITAFEHFHPDGLAQRIPSLAKLLEARESVNDPSRVRRLLEAAGAPIALDECRRRNAASDPLPHRSWAVAICSSRCSTRGRPTLHGRRRVRASIPRSIA